MLYTTLNSDYQVIVKGEDVHPFVYGKLDYDEGRGYVFVPIDGYPWECGTSDEEAALALIERDVNDNAKEILENM